MCRCTVELTAWIDRIEYPVDVRAVEETVEDQASQALASVLEGFEIEIDRCDCTLITDRDRLSRLFREHHAARVEAAKTWHRRAQGRAASEAGRDWPGVSADTRRALRAEAENEPENPKTEGADAPGVDAGDRPGAREGGPRPGARTLAKIRCVVNITGQDRLSAELCAEAEDAVDLALGGGQGNPWASNALKFV